VPAPLSGGWGGPQ